MPCQHKDGVFLLCAGRRDLNHGCVAGGAQGKIRLKFWPSWKRPAQEFNNPCNTLCTHRRVAGRTAKSYQKADVTGDAVPDRAKARQVDEETFFENGGQGIVEVGSLGKSPELLNDVGSFRCESEEIGKNPESFRNTTLKVRRWFLH